MTILRQKLQISFKNTLPTYLLISIFTLFLLLPGKTLMSFSRFGQGLPEKMLFSLAFNLLYFVPQFSGVFIGLHSLRKRGNEKITPEKARWFLRVPAPVSVLTTTILILTYFWLGFFPEDVDMRSLYIVFIIIILMNILFSLIMTINIYVMLTKKMKSIPPPRSE